MSLKSKKSFITVLAVDFLAAVVLVSCKASDNCGFLIGSWSRYDETLSENLMISFGEKNEYKYLCECNEPVDIYDTYSYNAEDKTITLSGGNGESEKLKLIYCDDYYLCIAFNGGAHTFKNTESDLNDDVLESARGYVKDDMLRLSVLGFENGKLTVATYNYDKDAHESFADTVFELETDENIGFCSVTVTVENGEERLETHILSREEYESIGENYHSGYVEIGENGKVGSVIFYGALEIYS